MLLPLLPYGQFISFIQFCMASLGTVQVGKSLQRLNISSVALLSFTHQSTCEMAFISPISVITNEVVLDLYHFMCRNCECTYKTVTEWLSHLYGEKWPRDQPPTVKAITQKCETGFS